MEVRILNDLGVNIITDPASGFVREAMRLDSLRRVRAETKKAEPSCRFPNASVPKRRVLQKDDSSRNKDGQRMTRQSNPCLSPLERKRAYSRRNILMAGTWLYKTARKRGPALSSERRNLESGDKGHSQLFALDAICWTT